MNKTFRKVIFLCVLLAFCVTGCKGQTGNDGKENELTRYNANFLDAFDTQTTVVGYAKTEEEFVQKKKQILGIPYFFSISFLQKFKNRT